MAAKIRAQMTVKERLAARAALKAKAEALKTFRPGERVVYHRERSVPALPGTVFDFHKATADSLLGNITVKLDNGKYINAWYGQLSRI
jgi:hypothetical protein